LGLKRPISLTHAIMGFNNLPTVDTLYILILEVSIVYTTIQKWGNSQAIRLPKGILEVASLRENDRVEINVENGCIIIKRTNKKHKTLEERLSSYNGAYRCTEWETEKPQGKEVW
jgi:antitoxin MazE